MKTFVAIIEVLWEKKVHALTAETEEKAKSKINEFWFDDKSLVIKELREITESEVMITKHN